MVLIMVFLSTNIVEMKPFAANLPILYPLETPKNQREYKIEELARNGFSNDFRNFTGTYS